MRPRTSARPVAARRRTLTAFTAVILGIGLVGAPIATLTASAVDTPASFSSVSARPGPNPGEVKFTWVQSGADTTSYAVDTGLTSFDAGGSVRGAKSFTFSKSVRTATLTPAQTASAGAPLGSGNHLYYRFRAVNTTSSGAATRRWAYLQTVAVAPAVPATTGTALRVGNFNVRTARATTDNQTWLQRAPAVARSIIDKHPGVLGLQELNHSQADGSSGSIGDKLRQTESLVNELAKQGASKYKLVKKYAYVSSGTPQATQGMRILYDTSKYSLVSPCVDMTGTSKYSTTCTIKLPLRPSGDDEEDRQQAAYAEFADKATGARFYFISVHLDSRSDSNLTVDKTYDAHRAAQVKAAIAGVAAVNTAKVPVVLSGDINTWQNDKTGYAAHDAITAAGFYDTFAAARQVNPRYTTLNEFSTEMPMYTGTNPDNGVDRQGWGSRLDVLTVKGVTGASYWENVFKNPDSARPSDHNMVISDIRLPGKAVAASTAYQPLTPARLLDTRSGVGAPKVKVPAGGRVDLQVTGRGGVPGSGVEAVVLNVTATNSTGSGYATVYPAGVSRPGASKLNFTLGQSVANGAVVKLGSGGKVSLYASQSADLVADVQGWFPTGSDLTALTPSRLLDTRNGTGGTRAKVPAGGTLDLVVTGRGGVPATGVSSVVLNVTGTAPAASGYLTTYPTGVARPPTSTVNYAAAQTVANWVILKVGTGGKVSIYSTSATDVFVDVEGWFPTGAKMVAVTPARILDTRTGLGATQAKVPAGGRLDLLISGKGGVPASGVSAVVLNVTATNSAGAGYVTVYPAGVSRPGASTLNLVPSRRVANGVIVKVGEGGKVSLYASQSSDLVADVVAYVKS